MLLLFRDCWVCRSRVFIKIFSVDYLNQLNYSYDKVEGELEGRGELGEEEEEKEEEEVAPYS